MTIARERPVQAMSPWVQERLDAAEAVVEAALGLAVELVRVGRVEDARCFDVLRAIGSHPAYKAALEERLASSQPSGDGAGS